MRPTLSRKVTICALLLASFAMTAFNTGCVASMAKPAPAAPLAPLSVSAKPSLPATPSAESSATTATNGSTPATGSAATSSTAASATAAHSSPRVAELPPPIAGLQTPLPGGDITGPRNLAVPVLMYHVIAMAPLGARYPDLYVKPGDFLVQMRYLADNGYTAVTLQQVYDFWHNRGTLPSKPVVLSFDDGDIQDFTVVAPLLDELQWPGVLNLIVGRHKPRLKPPIVRAMIQTGWEIDSHSITHTEVAGLSAKKLAFEVAESRRRLQRMYHVPVNFFCYPSGRFDANAVVAVRNAGYLGATTTLGGLAVPSEPFLMRRVRVLGGESIDSFAARLSQKR